MDCDLLVIGAGIHGAAVAERAAAGGYRVVVLEQYARPALGTSSKSSKLIHGGLRYLESGQLRLVRECLAERARLLTEQPDLVHRVPFYIPVYRHTRRPGWLIAAGLTLYSLLGGGAFRRVPSKRWPQLDGLRLERLHSVYRYWDAQTDDRKLTERLIDLARARGTRVHFDAEFAAAQCSAGGVSVDYRQAGQRHTLSAAALVNAAGPWVNRVLARISPEPQALAIELVQGTHIVVPGTLSQGIYYVEAPKDARAVFAMPWQGRILLGTTETPFQGDPAEVRPLQREVAYLLDTWNHYFTPHLGPGDVIERFAGLRVLPAGDARAFNRARDTRLHSTPGTPRLLSIYGGKLTSHGHTAQRVMGWLKGL